MPDEPIDKEYPCPHCGSRDRFIGRIAAKEVAKGHISPEDLPMGTRRTATAVADPNPKIAYVGQMKPGGVALWDFCLGCGREYPFRLIEREVMVSAIQSVMPQGRQGQQSPRTGMPPGPGMTAGPGNVIH